MQEELGYQTATVHPSRHQCGSQCPGFLELMLISMLLPFHIVALQGRKAAHPIPQLLLLCWKRDFLQTIWKICLRKRAKCKQLDRSFKIFVIW